LLVVLNLRTRVARVNFVRALKHLGLVVATAEDGGNVDSGYGEDKEGDDVAKTGEAVSRDLEGERGGGGGEGVRARQGVVRVGDAHSQAG